MISYKKAVVLMIFVGLIMSFSGGFVAKAGIGDIFTQQYWRNLLFGSGAPGASPSATPGLFNLPTVAPSAYRMPDYEAARIAAVKSASPAVVSIIISKNLPVIEQYYVNPFQGQGNDFFQQFFGQDFQVPQYRQNGTKKQQVGAGSGFIVSADGLIITNKHVVEDTEAEYTVLTNDEKKYPAKVLARDPVLDLALIKIDMKGLPTEVLGDSDRIELGQTAIAIGNALGEFRNTVSIGAVSGLTRQITASSGVGSDTETLKNVIQTDAAINPGNSGGPLINLRGEVIGINVAMVSGAQSIGFAIPINQAKSAIESVRKTGKIVTPYLGVRYTLVTDTLKEKNKLPVNYGALVTRGATSDELAVMPGSPADKAGIVENDIILEIDGKQTNKDNDPATVIRSKNVGDEITLKILHQGQEKTLKIKLEEMK